MGTLTGQQINNTYDGLLKLSDSTTGITNSLQAIEDGLGNNTGSRIATNYFTAPNVVSIDANLVPDFMGCGVGTGSGTAFGTNTQNRLMYNIFYDTGVHSYSAITYNLGTLTSSSDVVDFYFYSLQLVPTIGIAPKDLIMSGITLTSTGSTGLKTTTLPSTLSFSGTGGGYYVSAWYVSNAGVTPTVRYGTPNVLTRNQSYMESIGYFINATNNGIQLASKNTLSLSTGYVINNLPVQSTYSHNDIITNLNSSNLAANIGFGLNVIR